MTTLDDRILDVEEKIATSKNNIGLLSKRFAYFLAQKEKASEELKRIELECEETKARQIAEQARRDLLIMDLEQLQRESLN